MSKTSVDKDWAHLYPEFRERLERAMAEAERRTGHKWVMTEGFRSAERQTWLYAQGRTRPGKIVTWMRTPKFHGTGLAADCYPTKNGRTPDFSIGKPAYDTFRACYQQQGLTNPAWGKGDLGHVQLTGEAVRTRALAWVRAGFPASGPAPRPPAADQVSVMVNGHVIPDADGYLEDGRCFVALRPVADQLGWVIASVENGRADLRDGDATHGRDVTVPLILKGKRGFVAVRELSPLADSVVWHPRTRTVTITDAVK